MITIRKLKICRRFISSNIPPRINVLDNFQRNPQHPGDRPSDLQADYVVNQYIGLLE